MLLFIQLALAYNIYSMFMLHYQHSKGGVIANYQLVLKKEHTLEELTQIMNSLGEFRVQVEMLYRFCLTVDLS